MASRLTEFLGGQLRVRSQTGNGTHFTVAVPVFAIDPRGPALPHSATGGQTRPACAG